MIKEVLLLADMMLWQGMAALWMHELMDWTLGQIELDLD